MRFFGLKSCDTCRKARKALDNAGHDLQVIDVRADGVLPDDLDRFIAAFGDKVVNKNSSTWRSLSDADRQRNAFELLTEYPTLMKRPVIETSSGELYLGWKADVQDAILGSGN